MMLWFLSSQIWSAIQPSWIIRFNDRGIVYTFGVWYCLNLKIVHWLYIMQVWAVSKKLIQRSNINVEGQILILGDEYKHWNPCIEINKFVNFHRCVWTLSCLLVILKGGFALLVGYFNALLK